MNLKKKGANIRLLTSFSSSRWASRTFKMMSSVKPWKLEINGSCLSISVRTPKTRARVEPTSSERFSNNSLKTSLEKKMKLWYFYSWIFLCRTYLNFSLMTTQFPSLVNRISWVIQERLSLDLDWVLIFWSSSMISWICFWTSSPIRKKNQNIFFWWRFKFKHLAHTHTAIMKGGFFDSGKNQTFCKNTKKLSCAFFFQRAIL